MNFCRKGKSFISLVCAISMILSLLIVPVSAVDTNRVTAYTDKTIEQGGFGYCYVDIDSTAGLAALDVAVHFDPAKIRVISAYNNVYCTLYDSVINTDNVRFSYILDGVGSETKTNLFCFYYQVLDDAAVGDAHFDITIGEAYDIALNDVAVSGSRCAFKIKDKVITKRCYIYGTGSKSTSVDQEFTLNYSLSTYEIACGTAVITYDAELFEVVDVTNGEFLTKELVDVNAGLTGEIYVSFVGTEYNYSTEFASVTFKTLANVEKSSQITLTAPELLDKELNSIACNAYTTDVAVVFDDTYTKGAPSMKLDGTCSSETKQVTLDVTLEAGAHLGAGDFVITFDPELVSYKSSTKGFNPDFFNIDERNVANGELKFHIISLSDIVTEETVLTVVFDVKSSHSGVTADFTIDGSGLTDSMTNGIMLNFIDTSVLLEYQGAFDFEVNSIAPNATITAPTGGWAEGENTFTVSNSSACYVAVSYDGGKTYTRLAATKSGDAYAFTVQNLDAETIITVGLVGDLNGDGRIRAQEARQVLQASSGSTELNALQFVIADLNSDGRIRAQEARTLLQASSGSATLNW